MLTHAKKLTKSKFVRNVAIVATGTAGAQAITMAFATPIAALTYPIAIVLPKSDQDALGLAKLSALLAFGMASLVAIIILIFGDALAAMLSLESIAGFLLLLPVAMLFAAFHQILQQWLIRKKQFKITARVAVIQALTLNFEFQQRGEGQLSLINCSRRGMQEELGFNEYDERLGSLNVFDCFLVKDSFQFGLFAWASYSGYFEEIANNRAQDKAMESSELLALDFNGPAMREHISDTLFVPYTRVGLEGLCSIHGINTGKVDKKSWQYRKTWLKVAGKGLWRRIKPSPKSKVISG